MAHIATGSEGAGRKTVDSEIPLVPFIDLLLCCVMFLLVTAVWNQLAAVEANTSAATAPPDSRTVALEELPVTLELTEHDVAVRFPDGSSQRATLAELPDTLARVPAAQVLDVLPDDNVSHWRLIEALSALRGAGHERLRLPAAGPAG